MFVVPSPRLARALSMRLPTTGRWGSCACPTRVLTRFRRAASSTGCLQTLLAGSAAAAGGGDALKCVPRRMNETAEGDDMISDWTEVHETFDAMGLHENLLRGIYAYGEPHLLQLVGGGRLASPSGTGWRRAVLICPSSLPRFREAVRHSAEGHRAVLPRLRCDPAGPVRDWQDRHLLRWYPPPGARRLFRAVCPKQAC